MVLGSEHLLVGDAAVVVKLELAAGLPIYHAELLERGHRSSGRSA
jgi:hypothetical protein